MPQDEHKQARELEPGCKVSPMHLVPDMLPSDDFRFRLGTTPGDVEEFFALSSEAPRVLAERRHWLESAPALYSGLLDAGRPLLQELLEHASGWSALRSIAPPIRFDAHDPASSLLALGTHLEPDFVLMAPDGHGRFVVAGGCVCFPSAWRLTDKLGRTTEETHAPVTGLNAVLAPPIDRLMDGLRGGRCVVRWNWSIGRSNELNQHPDRNLAALTSPVSLDDPWLRFEHQSLYALPRTGGVVFGIRVLHYSWRALRETPDVASRMIRTLQTMPPGMLAYKRLDVVRDDLLRLLERE